VPVFTSVYQASLHDYTWHSHCHGLFELAIRIVPEDRLAGRKG